MISYRHLTVTLVLNGQHAITNTLQSVQTRNQLESKAQL